nr:unnamed protein product [Digitaria exilis]
MEKKPRAGADGDSRGEASGGSESGGLVERLPEALLVEVLGRLEVDDACSAAASCRALHGAASAAISAITTIDLSAFAPSNAILSRILAGNVSVRSVTVNCSLLDDSAASVIAKGSLRELSLLKCSFTMGFFVAIGERCGNLRRVNDFGILMLADGCKQLRTIRFGGFSKVSDAGYAALLHSGKDLKKFELPKLTLLDLAGADITDAGLSALGNGRAVTVISKNCEQISSLCLRNCLLITDSSLEVLGSMGRDSGKCSLKMLDLAYCSKLSRNFLRLFEPPLFRGLRWLGVGKNVVQRRGCSPTVAELLERKPGLIICGNACDMGCRNKCHPDIRFVQ